MLGFYDNDKRSTLFDYSVGLAYPIIRLWNFTRFLTLVVTKSGAPFNKLNNTSHHCVVEHGITVLGQYQLKHFSAWWCCVPYTYGPLTRMPPSSSPPSSKLL